MRDMDATLAEIDRLNHVVKPGEAEELMRTVLTTWTIADLRVREHELRAVLRRFLPKRRLALTDELDARLAAASDSKIQNSGSVPTPMVISRGPGHAISIANTASGVQPWSALAHEFTDDLTELSEYHIFQWATFYRDVFAKHSTQFLAVLQDSAKQASLLEMIREALSQHSEEVFRKGFDHLTMSSGSSGEDAQYAVVKSTRGLQRFLDLPLEFYSVNLRSTQTAKQLRALRVLLSVMLSSILQGYCRVTFNRPGSQLLPLYPQSWAHTLPFMTGRDFSELVTLLAVGDFRNEILRSVRPLVDALDVLTARDTEALPLPALSQLAWAPRRLDVSLYLPPGIVLSRTVRIQCYMDSSFVRRHELDEAASRGVTLVLAPLQAQLRSLVGSDERLAQMVVSTVRNRSSTSPSPCDQAVSILDSEVNGQGQKVVSSRTLQMNFAKDFPLERPSLATYFHVRRSSVRDLMRTFESRTGVRLWCSVRRSGKTTAAALDLETTSGRSVVITQTCDDTGVLPDGGIFYRSVLDALESGRQLSSSFFLQTVERSGEKKQRSGDHFVFVIDEYETLFGRLSVSLCKDRNLRYTVVQPLLNQMADFASDNLLVLLGQQPDAHFILMDKNQLSPYVEQDPFPLFQHDESVQRGEFVELLGLILSHQVEFDLSFANAVYAETGGHPYLTVNLLAQFCDWLIKKGHPISRLSFSVSDFDDFSKSELNAREIRTSVEYDFFRYVASHALSFDAKNESPWLYSVYECLRQIGLNSPDSFSCARADFDAIVEAVSQGSNFAPDHVLKTGSQANFLSYDASTVRPKIRLLSRLSATVGGHVAP